jgi:sulfite exporter TauE/SafE/copper chaperone CopZ
MAAFETKKLHIGGMTCVNCQRKIEKKLRNTKGVSSVSVSYDKGTASVSYDSEIVSIKSIEDIIRRLDYEVLDEAASKLPLGGKIAGFVVVILALYVLIQLFGIQGLFASFQLADSTMGYGMLFVIGLITSLHCVAMCGGINLSQCIPKAAETIGDRFASLRPALLYNAGRLVSYTLVGIIVGAIGSAIAFTGMFRGIVQLIAGVFMVIMGISMMGVLPSLRKFVPRMPSFIASKIENAKGRSKSPLYVGLLNGLMPCGPLQAMQLYALSTGSPLKGAFSMLLFCLGTIPLMFGLGALSSVLSRKFTKKMMTVGAVLVAVMGLTIFTNGWGLSGYPMPPVLTASIGTVSDTPSETPSDAAPVEAGEGDIQLISSKLASGGYPAITVKAGTPVKWVIDAPQGTINGCNRQMFIPEYDIEHEFQTGENVIEFVPDSPGVYAYSCWMGMIRSTITVV